MPRLIVLRCCRDRAAARQARLDEYLDKVRAGLPLLRSPTSLTHPYPQREDRMEDYHSGRIARAKANGVELDPESTQGFIGIGDSNTLGRALGTNGNGGSRGPYKA